MAKKIIILNGSPRKNGNTSALTAEFKRGAEEAGNTVTEFHLSSMKIGGCLGCWHGGKDAECPCVQKDDMAQIYPVYREADVVVLAVKPYMMETAIDDIVDVISPDAVVVSIAAGKTLEWIDQAFGMEMKLVRAMPSTPALVGEGVTGICANERVSAEELQTVLAMFRGIGMVESLSEPMIDVIGAVAGSTPA